MENKEPYNQRDHVHCFDQENPPCGIKLKDHKQCCLCELPMTTNYWEKRYEKECLDTTALAGLTGGRKIYMKEFIRSLLKERDLSHKEELAITKAAIQGAADQNHKHFIRTLIAELEEMRKYTKKPDDLFKGFNKALDFITSKLRERL